MKPMTYKGYAARIEYSDEDECFVGHLAGISDIVGFHGESVEGIKTAFHEAVDDYLEACKEHGMEPKRPYSGRIMLRISPKVHERAAMSAAAEGKSLNVWAESVLLKASTV